MITEERFKKLTPIQWIFHYKEIMKNKKTEIDVSKKLIELMDNLISNDLDFLAAVIDPKKAEQIMDIKNQYRDRISNNSNSTPSKDKDNTSAKKEDVRTDVTMPSFYFEAPKVFPMSAEVDKQSKYILPKYNKKKRKLGIQDDEVNDESLEESAPPFSPAPQVTVNKVKGKKRRKLGIEEGETYGNG